MSIDPGLTRFAPGVEASGKEWGLPSWSCRQDMTPLILRSRGRRASGYSRETAHRSLGTIPQGLNHRLDGVSHATVRPGYNDSPCTHGSVLSCFFSPVRDWRPIMWDPKRAQNAM